MNSGASGSVQSNPLSPSGDLCPTTLSATDSYLRAVCLCLSVRYQKPLFLVENVIPTVGVEDPIPASPRVAAYWAAIQKNEHAAATLVELYRGLAERRELIAKMAAKEKAKAQAGA